MAISRPFLLAVLGALLLGVTVLAVQNARTDSDAAPAALQTEPAPSTGKTTEVAGPDATLRSAFDLGEVDSGRFDARVNFQAPRAGGVRFRIAGAFDASAAGAIPELRRRRPHRRRPQGDRRRLRLARRPRLLHSRRHRLARSRVRLAAARRLRRQGRQAAAAAALDPPGDLGARRQVGGHAAHRRRRDRARLRQRSTRRPSSTTSARPCGRTAARSRTPTRVSRAVKRAELDVWVGSDDHILRRLSLDVGFGRGRGIDVDVRLSDVNEQQRIEAPAKVLAGAPGGHVRPVRQRRRRRHQRPDRYPERARSRRSPAPTRGGRHARCATTRRS